MQLPQGSKPFQQAIVHFQQHYDLMKSYLKKVFLYQDRKKKFIFVYEQCLKFYTKNNAVLYNHEVLKLIKMIFYILKKKMIAKCSNEVKLTINRIYDIFLMMANVYMSWQTVLMMQMTVEEQQFFSMLFRMREYKNEKGLKIPRMMVQNLILKPKPDSVVTSKINLEYKTYNFFKQLLRMTINSILVMIPCLNMSKIKRIVTTIKKGQKIMQQFPQHIFPVEKIQFYLLKCQIYEWASNQLGLCLNFNLKYQFPLGLFQLIYKNLGTWKEGKVMHYVNLLTKALLISGRNQLLSVRDIYVLSIEIWLLMKVVNKKKTLTEQQVNKEKKGQKNVKIMQNNKKINNSQQLSSKNKLNLEKGNSSQLTALNAVLIEIEKYLTRLREINHIISYYLRQDYQKYKNFDPKDQLVDEIPILIGQKKRLKKKNSQPNPDQQSRLRELFINSKSKDFYHKGDEQKGKDYRHTFFESDTFVSGHDGRLLKEKNNKSLDKKKQGDKQKCREIIIRNIMNVKVRKKKLILGEKKDNPVMDTKMKRMATMISTTLSQSRSNATFRKNPNQLGPLILQETLQHAQLPSLTPSFQHPINLLHQSSSQQEQQQQGDNNQTKYRFQTYRKQKISSINSKYYNATNINYVSNNNNQYTDHNEVNNRNNQLVVDGGGKFEVQRGYVSPTTNNNNDIISSMTRMSTFSNHTTTRMKTISEQIQYDQIKMLDDVIKDKVLTLLDVEIDNNVEDNNIQRKNIIEKGSQRSFINNYAKTKMLTSKLLEQVNRLNTQRKLLTEQLKNKMKNNKLFDSISQHHHELGESNVVVGNEMLTDLQDIYNQKGNITQKALSYQQLYRKLLHIDTNQTTHKTINIQSTLRHYAKMHKQYNNTSTKLSIIGETQQEQQLSQRTYRELQQHINLAEFIAQNAPQTIGKEKQQRQLKFNSQKGKQKVIYQNQSESLGKEKQIALREQFNNLSVDVSRSRFNYVNFANTNNTNSLLLKTNNEQDTQK